MGENKPEDGWLARRREQNRLKRERTGDTPEKAAERRKPQDATTVEDAAKRASTGGWVGGAG
jgi:hypothetical protein